MPHKAPRRVDENQRQIVAALRAAGCTVTDLHELGHGIPDLLVHYRDRVELVEVKRPRRGKLTPDQVAYRAKLVGQRQPHVVRTIDEAYAALGIEATPIARSERHRAQAGR